ncbi:plasmid mobilization protein [Arsenicicoccus bolidensis]|uniref:plasmid mobilization protein n=1 Tax=Arsenicicoccus bolidensis TaxID=229480 RepID=UPI0028ACE70E|nr:plasmid mobilization relaxosome protein MobC [Arsenicicoccus bolidensis]
MTAEDGAARPHFKAVRLSDQEWADVQRRMEAGSFTSFSAYARSVLVHGELRVTTVAYDPRDLRAELARIGNNINQIARMTNVENYLAADQAVQARRLMQQVQKLLTEAANGAR